MIKIPVFRVRALDKEIAEILAEADGRCATAFALRLDEMRERLAMSLEAVNKNEARIFRRYADKDPSGKFLPDDKSGSLKFSTVDQQEKMQDELGELAKSFVEIDDETLGKIAKADLTSNGLAVGGQRMANLRPILDTASLDEPYRPLNDRTVTIPPPPRGTPHA